MLTCSTGKERQCLAQLARHIKQVRAAPPWTPSPATCKVSVRTSVSRKRKKSTDPHVARSKDTAELQERETWLLAARRLLSSDRFHQGWATQLVPSVSDQHQPFLRAHFHHKCFGEVRQHVGSPSSVGISEQILPHRKQGQTRCLFLPRKPKPQKNWSHSHDFEKPGFCSAHSQQ